MKKPAILLLVFLLVSPVFLSLQLTRAETQPILADVINNVVSGIQTTDSPWSVIFSQIFGLTNASVFDDAILKALSQNDYQDVIFIGRLAEINGYSSTVINNSLVTALQNFPMVGSLPKTYSAAPEVPDSFMLYDRYMINAYRYAQELNVSGWNLNQAFLDFANAYLKPPAASISSVPVRTSSGEMLWINPAQNYSESYTGRYYDEHAETLDMFLLLALARVNATISYDGQQLNSLNFMDDAWLNTQSLWNGQFYGYNTNGQNTVECEMGNFAQIISEYQNYRGNIPYFNRVIQDLEYTLLAENFSSPIWNNVGVIGHYQGASQERLCETLGNLFALQMFYPYFNMSMQGNFRGMLESGAWQGLTNSELFSNNQFQFTNDPSGFGDDASSVGVMTLFLDGIVPQTGCLAMNASDEKYQDYRTCFPTSQWQFNYQNNSIRIPVSAGNLSFIFGSQEVTQNFPSNGVYQVQFASDWNSVFSITKIADVNSVSLSPATLQTITRPAPTPSPTPKPRISPTPSVKPTAQPTTTPTQTPTETTATPTLEPRLQTKSFPTILTEAVLGAATVGAALVLVVVYVRKRRR